MKFMEIDDGGFIHHICDDPEITITPLVNRVSHGDKDGKPLKHPVTGKGMSFRGNQWLPPLSISDADYQTLMTDGLTGTTDKGTNWHYKYDIKTKQFTKATVL